MNWEIIGSTGEWAGAIAVVVTLFYLARQIRQQNINTTATSTDSWLADYNNTVLELVRDPEFALIFRQGLTAFPRITPNDQLRFHAWMVAHLLNAENMHLKLTQGILDAVIANQVLGFSAAMLKSAGVQAWWQSAKLIWNANPEFVDFLDQMISETRPITETWPWFSSEGERIEQGPDS